MYVADSRADLVLIFVIITVDYHDANSAYHILGLVRIIIKRQCFKNKKHLIHIELSA